jgi:hypothetical protein
MRYGRVPGGFSRKQATGPLPALCQGQVPSRLALCGDHQGTRHSLVPRWLMCSITTSRAGGRFLLYPAPRSHRWPRGVGRRGRKWGCRERPPGNRAVWAWCPGGFPLLRCLASPRLCRSCSRGCVHGSGVWGCCSVVTGSPGLGVSA